MSGAARGTRLVWLAIAAIAAVAHAACGASTSSFGCDVQTSIAPPPGTQFARQQIPAVSPDGSRLAVTAAAADGTPGLWLHSLRDATDRAIGGTGGATFPFWSPDSQQLGFFAGGQLKRVDLQSGAVDTLTDAPDALGGSWSAAGQEATILFSRGPAHAIFRVAAGGGTVRQVTHQQEDAGAHAWPTFLADGEHFVYSSLDRQGRRRILLGSLRSSEQNSLLEGTESSAYVGRGFMLFAGDDVLYRMRFNPKILEIEEPPTAIAQGINRGAFGMTSLAAAPDGSAIVYGRAGRALVWLDAAGHEHVKIAAPGAYRYPQVSPAGEILVAVGGTWRGMGPWSYQVYDPKTDRWRRVVDQIESFARPLWSADGAEVIFTASDGASATIMAARADGSGVTRQLFEERAGAYAASVSKRGGSMAIVERQDRAGLRIRVVSVASGRGLGASTVWESQPGWSEYDPALSPDGRRLAYISRQAGEPNLYVTELSPGAAPSQLSSRGGAAQPVWSPDGTHLLYRDASGIIALATDGPPSTWRSHVVLADADAHARLLNTDTFDPNSDGSRLLLVKMPDPRDPLDMISLSGCSESRRPTVIP